jgi:hypothetical protein
VFAPLIGRKALTLLCGLVLTSSAVGCGGNEGGATTVASTPAAAPATQEAPAPTTTEPTATTGEPEPEQSGGQGEGEGEGGDEEPMRVPATFMVADGALSPKRIVVPAFLTIELKIIAARKPATVTIDLPGGPRTYELGAGSATRRRIAGLHPGDYAVHVNGGGSAVLHVVAGGAPGP